MTIDRIKTFLCRLIGAHDTADLIEERMNKPTIEEQLIALRELGTVQLSSLGKTESSEFRWRLTLLGSGTETLNFRGTLKEIFEEVGNFGKRPWG